ncbi:MULTISPECIES: hypothetical protein [unclassified Rhodococcus (in: high G+C Gram-positive bacteria)]|uniref:hypothetical protein n=1 Tax=unclassified Rhodococcus (in: high G+C Gram-positive bacteria) TaxID=192944 RepID=UPI0005DAE4CE|nr:MULTISPECIES: hypothetical protein [unclassified Rhodococcus (in: high G+C Gram-positive bacteria)]KJF21921.1 hypothetical protein SZ00_02565 [Rhodococcus sp. AD45]
MAETRWWKYVKNVMGDDTAREAATRAGFDKSAFTRWKNGANADPEFVLKFARAYNENVLHALVEAEFLTEEEAGLREVQINRSDFLRTLTIAELTDELHRKVQAEKDDIRLSRGMSPSEVNEQLAKAEQLGLLKAAATEFGERARTVPDNVRQLIQKNQPLTIDDLDGLPYVAHTADPDEGEATDHDFIP